LTDIPLPDTRYAQSDNVSVAYQVEGLSGRRDLFAARTKAHVGNW
jgi:hypothetical protein